MIKFADNHFKSALKEFNNEMLKLKDQLPEDFKKIEKLSNDLKSYFNTLLETKLFDEYKIQDLKSSLKKSLFFMWGGGVLPEMSPSVIAVVPTPFS